MRDAEAKKEYSAPELKDFGRISDLTQTGLTNPGTDGKGGSAASSGT